MYKSILVVIAIGLSAVSAFAQQRTFVSVTGVDNPTCSRPSPCRNFNAAVTAVTAGGEVIAIDSGGYGTVVVNKPVSIIAAPGVYAGITVFSGVGILINAPGGIVVLRGLHLNGLGGQDAIELDDASMLHVENVVATGFLGSAMFLNAQNARFAVRDSEFRHNGYGIFVNIAATSQEGSIDHTRFDGNANAGIELLDNTKIVVRDSVFFNDNDGVRLQNGAGSSEATVDNCIFSAASKGVWADASNQGTAVARVGRTTFVDLLDGIFKSAGGNTLRSFGNNQFDGNVSDGTFDTIVALK